MDNSAIARIASPDLSDDALALLNDHMKNDDVVFFLGRFVWQGEMVNCGPALANIAGDPSRGRFARIAAVRGVMAVGDIERNSLLWETITDGPAPLDLAVLAELLDWAMPAMRGVELLLRALEHTEGVERFDTSGLVHALHRYIDRLPIMADSVDDHPLARLVEGLHSFFTRPPYIERGECHVSQHFAWLMPAALHAIDRLVAARSGQALLPAAIAVMCNMPALRFWREGDFDDYKDSLSENVPRWPDLNDLLYWTSIAEARSRLVSRDQPLVDDWQVSFIGHLWGFGPEDFERCLQWVRTKTSDDQLVALSRCIQLYIEANRPAAWLVALRETTIDLDKLKVFLEARLDPKPSRAAMDTDVEDLRWKRKNERRDRKVKKDRADWVRTLKADPERILDPVGLKPGDFSNDQYHLLLSCMNDDSSNNREDGANWQSLVLEFGEPVARAYRDAAVAHWRAYRPKLRSEGADPSSTPYSLIFAMSGLAIEAAEDSSFAQRLTPDQARLAFRYINWKLNGFPDWFEPLYREFPAIGHAAVAQELVWELENSGATQPSHYILHDVLYYAPWLHSEIAPLILDWLRVKDVPNEDNFHYCLNILSNGITLPSIIADLASIKAQNTSIIDQRPRWFSLWVDTDPAAAIPALQSALEALSYGDASTFAQQFAVGLLGDRHRTATKVGAFRNAQDLKTLYVLTHRFIRVTDDIERAGKGAYSPTLRDDAQAARNKLFNMLSEVPGPDAYAAIKALEREHPEPDYRVWMAARARERAITDADGPAWTAEQVRNFEQAIVGF